MLFGFGISCGAGGFRFWGSAEKSFHLLVFTAPFTKVRWHKSSRNRACPFWSSSLQRQASTREWPPPFSARGPDPLTPNPTSKTQNVDCGPCPFKPTSKTGLHIGPGGQHAASPQRCRDGSHRGARTSSLEEMLLFGVWFS